MKKQIRLSVIMPVYNTPENFLRPAIESVLNQTFRDFELIIVNDGSTKNDITNIVKSYSDDRIRYFDNSHVGAACARNIGLDNAIGDFILIIDSDDVVDRNLYENLIGLADHYNPDIVIFNIYGDKDDGTIEYYENIIPFNITNPGPTTKMVRRELINNNYIRFQDLSSCNDVCFSYTCLAYATKVVKINKCFYHYNTNVPGQISQNRGKKCYNICKAMDALKFNLEKRNIFDIYRKDWLSVFRGAVKYESSCISSKKERCKFLRYVNFMYPDLYPWKHHLFYKWHHNNGHRYIYFCGIRVFSYRKTEKFPYKSDINYKTYNDMLVDIKQNITKLPTDIDYIVGIPRSGMVPAYMLGLALNKPVCTLQEFILQKFGKHGVTRKIDESSIIKKILFIDDTVNTGLSMTKVKQEIGELVHKYECIFGAVYATNKKSMDYVDFAFCILPQPRLFQWNYMNCGFLKWMALDIDGVLCIDPTEEQNDDGENYKQFILNAKPLYVPKVEVGALVTSRLEKYRKETEFWLSAHGVKYKNLYMLKGVSAEERRKSGLHAKYKAKVYKKLKGIKMFVESDDKQAQEIAKLTSKHVFCASNDKLY